MSLGTDVPHLWMKRIGEPKADGRSHELILIQRFIDRFGCQKMEFSGDLLRTEPRIRKAFASPVITSAINPSLAQHYFIASSCRPNSSGTRLSGIMFSGANCLPAISGQSRKAQKR